MRVKSTSIVLLVVASLALAGCSSGGGATSSGGPIRIVASTNVYGDIASKIGGSLVKVDSIISDPSQDPHSYQADAQVQLALSQAQIVIENGGGYDDFVDTLLKGANNQKAVVLTAANISGYDQKPSSGQFNEHLWYDFPTMKKVVDRIVASLTTIDASGTATFTANAKKFTDSLATLQGDEAAIKASFHGDGVAITEAVPLYLLDACGLVNKTPAKFSEAIEAGTDVSPVALKDTLALFSNRSVKLLAYNEQTSGPQTQQVLAAAKSAGVAVVPVRETLPSGKDYLGWMTDTLTAVKAALG
ncbi:MAG: Zinc/manganese transport system substrate-binding protein [Microbacteriaceae bacterium]|jgi:zinc/manganese transport system substrate-binding protein|nr:Zinc/manganese transport system substrate-binding protein [Microbacteriaceae bacterium]